MLVNVLIQTAITFVILQADKFLKCDWLRPEVFKPNLKYLHVQITPGQLRKVRNFFAL